MTRFVFSSSCSTYGAAGDDFLDETASLNPVTPYGESKVLSSATSRLLADERFSPTYMRNATAYGVSPRLRLGHRSERSGGVGVHHWPAFISRATALRGARSCIFATLSPRLSRCWMRRERRFTTRLSMSATPTKTIASANWQTLWRKSFPDATWNTLQVAARTSAAIV